MIKKRKDKKKVLNQGNSFVMVVATLSFLAVLVAAMLVAVALCYRLKAYDINARDNFYYLEQAMDEIYAGVGADAMMHLNDAYDDTIEVLVYFDAKTQSYITMKNDEANRILKNTYMNLVQSDPRYSSSSAILTRFDAFLSNKYDGSNEGVQVTLEKIEKTDDALILQNLVLKREATYSTVNTRKSEDESGNTVVSGGDTFVQTITTDLVIGKPEFDVNFNTIDSNLNELYKFAFVADKGVEIGNATSKVNITGNIYAAADFYNKDYNLSATGNTDPGAQYETVSSYTTDSDKRYKDSNGRNEKSMYSGLYIDGADVVLYSDRVIVPGTIAAFNSANVMISGTNTNTANKSEVWADGIVLGGYSLVKSAKDNTVQGSILRIRGDAYIADDLELNAEASDFDMVGEYYGYNYATLDNRTYTDACVKVNGGRSYTSSVSKAIQDGATIEGQAHYNSSSIIVNGEDSSLDLSGVTDMYIAGQAYIETSKKVTKHETVKDADGNDVEYLVVNKDGKQEAVTYKTYDYEEKSLAKDKDDKDDNYTTSTSDFEDGKESTNIQDYRTGEAISIKSNQLAYIPNWMVVDNDTGLYISVPEGLQNMPLLNEFWDDGDAAKDLIAKIPVIKSVISGKTYYFFDFSTEATKRAGVAEEDVDVMNRFMEEYTKLFTLQEGETVSQGDAYGLTNITDYEYFKVKMLKINTTYDAYDKPETVDDQYKHIYSNSAITVKNGTSFTIKADSSSIDPLKAAATNLNANIAEKTLHQSNVSGTVAGSTAGVLAKNVTSEIQRQYKEVKWTLTPTSSDKQGVEDAQKMAESDITPINYFFDFSILNSSSWTGSSNIAAKLNSGYKVWVCDGDVEVDAKDFVDGNVKGMVICKGDVTFADDVKSFEGLVVSGSKIKIEKSMNITANEEIVKTILRECDEAQLDSKTLSYFNVCKLFKQYQSIYKVDNSTGKIETESAKSISAVQFEDILSFNNWKKNVD